MYNFFVGCDMSKSFFDVSFYQDNNPVYLGQFSNDIPGFKKMVRQLKKVSNVLKTSWFVCFENTGVYSKALVEWLISQQIPCREENALTISKSLGIRRGKNDKADSKDICKYGFEKRSSIEPTVLSKPGIIKLKKLLSRRDLLVRQKQGLLVSIKEQKLTLDPKLLGFLESQNQELLAVYARQIKELEKQIQQTIDEDEEMKTNNELAQSVVGIGLVNSAYMIAYTDNFSSFETSRKFATFCGIAPFEHYQSGNKKGIFKVSHIANKKIKSLLSNAVNAAIMYDSELTEYYQRKLGEGKAKGVVLNALKNKLVHRVFAVVKRQTPYVKMMTYK